MTIPAPPTPASTHARGLASRRHPGGGDAGFSLVELLVVVVIIAILSAIAIPVFLNQRNKALNVAARSDARNLTSELEAVKKQDGTFAQDGSEWTALGSIVKPTTGVGLGYVLNCSFTVSGNTPTFVVSPGNYITWAYPKTQGAWGSKPGTSVYFYTSLKSTWFVSNSGYDTSPCTGTWQSGSWDGNP